MNLRDFHRETGQVLTDEEETDKNRISYWPGKELVQKITRKSPIFYVEACGERA
jgi:hypothetical protein